MKQLRLAETEKYAHVTFFFNGGEEAPFSREQRILVPSPREVDTYDLKPEMNAFGVRDRLLKEIRDGDHDLICSTDGQCGGFGPCVPSGPCIAHPDVGLSWSVQAPEQDETPASDEKKGSS